MKDETIAESEAGPLPPAKVLSVDDTPANLLAVSAILEPLGCEIIDARSGWEALEVAAKEELAVILLDVMMPGMDGFETLERLRTIPNARDTPVMLLTAYDLDRRAVERAFALGAVDYVPKPIAPEVLRGKVAGFLALYRAGQEIRRRSAALVAKDRHIAVLAHDLRNPLTSIAMAAHVLSREGTEPRVQRVAERVARAAARMDAMIRDLMDYARAGMGAFPIAPVQMDCGQLCRELVDEFLLADPGREIELLCTGELVGTWDRARLFQALSNLVGNAIRYGSGRASVRAEQRGDHVEIAVHNQGPPIAPALLPVIFEPFERGTQDSTGLGLGLYIVREIARVHGGDVTVTSSAERGTTFILRLPQRRS